MACACKQKSSSIKCVNCGVLTTINYEKGQDPLVIAAEQGKKCRKCKGSVFETIRR